MVKGEQLYEGKAKKVFATDDPELLLVSYKDDATAFNGLKKGTIAGKGVINNKMSNALMHIYTYIHIYGFLYVHIQTQAGIKIAGRNINNLR